MPVCHEPDLACTVVPRHDIKAGAWRGRWGLGRAPGPPASVLRARPDLQTTSSLSGSREDYGRLCSTLETCPVLALLTPGHPALGCGAAARREGVDQSQAAPKM